MRARILLVLLLSAVALYAVGTAEESPAYNLMVSDQGVKLIESFTRVRIFAIDPETKDRLDEKAVLALSGPENPIKIWLEPGHYEFMVSVEFARKEIVYFRFEIVEDERTLIDLTRIEFPAEFYTEKAETR